MSLGGACALPIDPSMDGQFQLVLTLDRRDRGRVTGFGILTLANGRHIAVQAMGKEAAGLVILRVGGDGAMDPSFAAVRLRLTLRTLADGTADGVGHRGPHPSHACLERCGLPTPLWRSGLLSGERRVAWEGWDRITHGDRISSSMEPALDVGEEVGTISVSPPLALFCRTSAATGAVPAADHAPCCGEPSTHDRRNALRFPEAAPSHPASGATDL
jgi:hypothetical protein